MIQLKWSSHTRSLQHGVLAADRGEGVLLGDVTQEDGGLRCWVREPGPGASTIRETPLLSPAPELGEEAL